MSTTNGFLRKLYRLLSQESPSIVGWAPCGTRFQVYDVARFEAAILPQYFRLNSHAAFVALLAEHGFVSDDGCHSHPDLSRSRPVLQAPKKRSHKATSRTSRVRAHPYEHKTIACDDGLWSALAAVCLQTADQPPSNPLFQKNGSFEADGWQLLSGPSMYFITEWPNGVTITRAMAGSIASGFVRKLYLLLDKESADIIAWDEGGKSFSIRDREQLDATVLPKYFRGKLAAFHQQLLDHGFKWTTEADDSERYEHESFVRGEPGLLDNIVRVPQPKCKTFPKLKKARKERRRAGDPYVKKTPPPPASLQVEPGSHEELVWKAINHLMYSNDNHGLFPNASGLLNTPGFTPSMVQLGDPIPPVVKGPNPLFQATNGVNPLFHGAKSPLFDAPAPSANPLFQKTPSTNPLFQSSASNPLFQSAPATNPLFLKAASTGGATSPANPLFGASTNPLFGAAQAAPHLSPAAAPALFKTQAETPAANEWQHLLSSSVDRFMQSTDKFTSAEDTFKFIMEERTRIAEEKTKLPAKLGDELFPNLGTAPDALLTFLMGSSVDLLQRSVDTFEQQLTQLHMSDTESHDDEEFGIIEA
ncbi:hypothetical protein ACHHYP_05291 [Achlya hypogyna]|uniref:HSF-type DNA-binding domain-containing protein n=1 Tax=Achlya hypogyna TaxID=1202772 RepID=A0A1V9YYF3_ACHHY|nr:hypothetical protein ACHHYP_05291 [Achlya hypogyna]